MGIRVEKRIKLADAVVSKDELYTIAQEAGEEAVNIARIGGTFMDRTGNLRSSIGYKVYVDGRLDYKSDTAQYSGPKGNGSQGAQVAENILNAMDATISDGVELVIFAGMNYAQFVEEKRTVLSEAIDTAIEAVDDMLNDLI